MANLYRLYRVFDATVGAIVRADSPEAALALARRSIEGEFATDDGSEKDVNTAELEVEPWDMPEVFTKSLGYAVLTEDGWERD